MKRDFSKSSLVLLSLSVGVYAAACAADAGDPLKTLGSAITGPDGSLVGDDASDTTDSTTLPPDDAMTVANDSPGTVVPPDDSGPVVEDSGGTPEAAPIVDSGPPAPSCSTCPIELKYLCGTTTAMSQGIRPHYDIYNNGTSAQSLTELTVRYYFTADTSQSQTYNCDYALIGCTLIQGKFVTMATPTTTADHYLEISFTGGSIAPGGNTGEIQNRFQGTNFVSMTQTNDYSFDATKTAYADWMNVTVYRNGTLIWGMEP